MTPEPRTIASQILIALDHDYAGMPECDDHAGKAWHKLFRKADELGLLDDDLLEAMMQERLAHLDDPNLRLMRLGADASATLESAPCTFEARGDAAVLTVGNLDSTEAADLLAEHADQVRAAKKLVIDMRDCTGGVEQAAYPLLDWLFDEPTTLETLIGTQQVLTNYSTGACKARIAQFTQLKTLLEAQGAGDTTAWLDQGLQAAQDSMGKGFVEESLAPAPLDIAAAPAGQHVFVLTSARTADAAEWLASVAKKSARATQVGQATCGTLDYSNPVTLAFGDRFVFTYPMTKTAEAAQGKGIRGTGITPDVACPTEDALAEALSSSSTRANRRRT